MGSIEEKVNVLYQAIMDINTEQENMKSEMQKILQALKKIVERIKRIEKDGK
jgi:hypothetical protein